MSERLGKTEAVRQAIAHLEKESFDGCICMTDADAFLPPNALSRLQRWFADRTIGAVEPVPYDTSRCPVKTHRSMFEFFYEKVNPRKTLRPFWKVRAWRSSCFQSIQLNTLSNADDAQIATGVRLNGFRSIHDSEVYFEDVAPMSPEDNGGKKIRRGQGLQRLLMSHRKSWFDRRLGTFSSIPRREAHFHILAPLAGNGCGVVSNNPMDYRYDCWHAKRLAGGNAQQFSLD